VHIVIGRSTNKRLPCSPVPERRRASPDAAGQGRGRGRGGRPGFRLPPRRLRGRGHPRPLRGDGLEVGEPLPPLPAREDRHGPRRPRPRGGRLREGGGRAARRRGRSGRAAAEERRGAQAPLRRRAAGLPARRARRVGRAGAGAGGDRGGVRPLARRPRRRAGRSGARAPGEEAEDRIAAVQGALVLARGTGSTAAFRRAVSRMEGRRRDEPLPRDRLHPRRPPPAGARRQPRGLRRAGARGGPNDRFGARGAVHRRARRLLSRHRVRGRLALRAVPRRPAGLRAGAGRRDARLGGLSAATSNSSPPATPRPATAARR
jgi:hypothetical protein